MEESISVFERINSSYYDLSASEKKIGDYILSHQSRIQFMSISELAEASSVSEATVTRFVRRLEYSGYNAFRMAIVNDTAGRTKLSNPLSGEVEDDDSFTDVCQKLFTANMSALSQTLQLVNADEYIRAADILESARRVICMGQGGSMIIADEAAHLFSTASDKYVAVADSHLQIISAATMSNCDAVLFFSYSGATKDMVDTLKTVKKSGGKVILVTHFPKSPGAAYADAILLCGADESPLQLGSIGARIAQLYLMDILFSELCRRNLDACRERRSIIADALTEKHI